MEVKKTPNKEKSQVELDITISAKEFEPYINKAAKELSTHSPIKGFRPGKAPIKVIAESLGHERLLKDAMDKALPHFFIQAVMDHDVEAINRPSITVEELGLDKPFRFIATVDVLPEVKLGDISKVKASKKEIKVTDKDIDNELKQIAKTRSTFIDVTKPAEKGDTVTVDFTVSINGEPIEGGESKNHPITLGEEYFVPDFEKNLIGIEAGKTRAFEIVFPENFAKSELQGKKADVKVVAHSVQKRVLPEINDEFAKQIGKFDDLEHLRKEFKKGITQEKEQKEKERYQAELAEQLADLTTFSNIPEILIEKEIDRRIEEFANMLAYQQKTVEDYLTTQNKTIEDIREEMKPASLKNIKIHLALQELAKKENIEVTEKEIEEKAAEYLQHYKSIEEAEKSIDPHELHENIQSLLRNQKTLQKLEEITKKK